MKRFVAAGLFYLLTLTCIGGAVAADLPQAPPPQAAAYVPPPVYNWSGPYIGLNAGYAWGSGDATLGVSGNFISNWTSSGSGSGINGAIAGGQIGFNWQVNSFVLGVEADADWSGQELNQTIICGFACAATESLKISALGTARARVGFAIDRTLLYATGGGAWASMQFNGVSPVAIVNLSDDRFGWTVGGGVEYGVTDWLSLRAEYLFVEVNGFSASAAIPAGLGGGTLTGTLNLRDSIARAGIDFRFPIH
jgi:outer membrane immunogenic protein